MGENVLLNMPRTKSLNFSLICQVFESL
uniref:Uncharacterized protein n=1 Tax=mine drainage metagenome TaxID=410659 RepID=E6PMY1_9ZZZZ